MNFFRRQISAKSAARKLEFVDNTSDEASENDSTMDNDFQEDQLLPEEYDLPQRLDGEQGTLLRPSTIFNPAPQITTALSQVKAEPEDDLPLGFGPPEECCRSSHNQSNMHASYSAVAISSSQLTTRIHPSMCRCTGSYPFRSEARIPRGHSRVRGWHCLPS